MSESVRVPESETVRVLEEALELIRDEDSWCQGSFRKPELNQRCALAAVTDARDAAMAAFRGARGTHE